MVLFFFFFLSLVGKLGLQKEISYSGLCPTTVKYRILNWKKKASVNRGISPPVPSIQCRGSRTTTQTLPRWERVTTCTHQARIIPVLFPQKRGISLRPHDHEHSRLPEKVNSCMAPSPMPRNSGDFDDVSEMASAVAIPYGNQRPIHNAA